jgi:outer membrane protein
MYLRIPVPNSKAPSQCTRRFSLAVMALGKQAAMVLAWLLIAGFHGAQAQSTSAALDCPIPDSQGTFAIGLAIERMLCIAPETRIAEWRVERIRQEITEAKTGLKPSIELRANTAYTDQRHGNAQSGVRSLTPGLGIAQTVLDSGATRQRVALRQANLHGETFAQLQTGRELISDIHARYLSWAQAHEIAGNAEILEALALNTQRIVNARLNAGRATRVDLLNAQSQVIEAKRQRLVADADLRIRAQLLFGRLQLPVDSMTPQPLDALDSLANVPLHHRDTLPEQPSVSPEIERQLAAVQSARHALAAEQATARWNVRVSGFTGPRRQSGNVIPGLNEAWYTEFAINATLPVYDAGARSARIAQLQTDLDLALEQSARTSLDMRLKRASAQSTLEVARVALEAAQQSLDAAKQTESARRAQFEAGVVSLTDVITAQNEVGNRSRQWITAKAELRNAEFALALLQGALDEAYRLNTSLAP